MESEAKTGFPINVCKVPGENSSGINGNTNVYMKSTLQVIKSVGACCLYM